VADWRRGIIQTRFGTSFEQVCHRLSTMQWRGTPYLTRPRNVAIVIGFEIGYADQTIYAAGLNLRDPQIAVPVGPGCRACERLGCSHRALLPANQALELGTEVRGVVPYRIRGWSKLTIGSARSAKNHPFREKSSFFSSRFPVHQAALTFNSVASRLGGSPNIRAYSRLNCDALSYPT
jgi:hypothetical protein